MGCFLLVDLKGIEPSNLTDANRALSQLSYKPLCFFALSRGEQYVLYHRILICKEKILIIFFACGIISA